MVKSLRENEPMWISKINRRMSIHKFRENASYFRSNGQDFSRVLRNLSNTNEVYEVTVETWTKGDITLWVPPKYVEATGEMLTRFLETNESEESTLIENDVTISDLIELDEEEEKENESEDDDGTLNDIDGTFFEPIEVEHNDDDNNPNIAC